MNKLIKLLVPAVLLAALSIGAPPACASTGTAIDGQNVCTISVAAQGTAPFSYQWFYSPTLQPTASTVGTAIAGATAASYVVNGGGPATIANAGSYWCVVTNSAGSASSDFGVLTVTGAAPYGLVTNWSIVKKAASTSGP